MNHFYIQRRCIISGCKIQCQNLDTNKAIDMYKRYDLRKKKSCLIWTSLIGVDVWYLILEQFRNCTEALFVYSRFCALLKLSNWQIYLNRFIVVDVLVFSSAINPAILHFYCIMQKFQASWWCFVLQINTYFGSLRSKVISLLNRLITHRVIKFCRIFFINPKALNFYLTTTASIFIDRHLEQRLLFLFIWSFFLLANISPYCLEWAVYITSY